ncbi:MAG: cupin domain-containing protein [Acidobacteria bacterium]|nr:cupin domain-containing protein [Acidobacteriota bacterium]MBA3886618.1 cupin domain-containing protein [Acidobacteriota bacterium]
MKLYISVVTAPLFIVLAFAVLLAEPLAAQYARTTPALLDSEWENDRLRVSRVTAEPGAALRGADADRILVYLTADADGQMSPAEAVWQPAGSGDLENRGRARVDAIAIELKDAPTRMGRGTPPEALSVSRSAEVRHLVDNPRVLVTGHRSAPGAVVDPPHFHTDDVLVVYLRGGHIWPAAAGWGATRVRRGDVDVVPANTLHRLANAGGDPLEFLVIVPR